MIKLIEKIEGEAKLHFSFEKKKINHVDIEFMSTRNIEKILEGKPALDALVINPRVCGICGHAHLLATVQALENCYENLELSPKAKLLRELTLNFELILKPFQMVLSHPLSPVRTQTATSQSHLPFATDEQSHCRHRRTIPAYLICHRRRCGLRSNPNGFNQTASLSG